MKKFVLFSVFVVFGCLNAFGVVGQEFTVQEHPNMRFTVTSSTPAEVSVKANGTKSNITGELNIPDTVQNGNKKYAVTAIADNAFNGSKITKLVIPKTVKTIGKAAFRDITNPFTVTFNEGLEVIGNRAFCTSPGLKDSLIFPATLQTIGSLAFSGDSIVSYIEFKGTKPVTLQVESGDSYTHFKKNPHNPASDCIVDVIYVPNGSEWRDACMMVSSPKSISIGVQLPRYPFASKTTETVQNNILYDIHDLNGIATTDAARIVGVIASHPKNIEFPDTIVINNTKRAVTYAKAFCFGGKLDATITSIEHIKFPKTMRHIGAEAFRSIDSYFTLELNEGLLTIGNRAFCRSTGLLGTPERLAKKDSSLVIPSTVEQMEEYCFCQCFSIKDSIVMLPHTPPTVPDGQGFLFAETPAVIRIQCGDIDNYHPKDSTINYWSTRTLFDACDHDIIMGPTFLYRIIDHDKKYLSLLGRHKVGPADIVVPDSVEKEEGQGDWYYVKKIAENAFNKSNMLTSLKVPVGVDTIESRAFYENTSLKTIEVASAFIKENAFYQCSALENLTLDSGVVHIFKNSFTNCTKLKQIVFPQTIQLIDDYAFNGSRNIKEVEFLGTVPPKLGGDNILSTGEGTTLEKIWVPCGLYNTYYTTNHGPGRWIKLQSYLRSRCRELDLKEGEDIAADETVSSIALHRTFNINEWTPLYLPFAVDSVLAVIDGVHYDINYPYSAKYGGGYFYLQKFHEIHNEQVCFTAADTIETGVNYIIRFPDDYFSNMEIVFKTKAREYNVTATPSLSEQTSSTYVLAGNNGYTHDELSVGYLMEGASDGTISFVRHIPCTVSPFSFVLLPPAQLQANPSKAPLRLRMRTSEDKDDDVTTSVSNTEDSSLRYCYDGKQLTIYPAGAPCTIHSIEGDLLYTIDGTQESVVLHLPAGLYIANSKGNCQKILL